MKASFIIDGVNHMNKNKIKYLLIYDILKQKIIDGEYSIGDTFPAEPELQEYFNVSRITVRHAVQILVDEGYLQRIHGVGTIVVSQKESLQLQSLLSFSEENKNVETSSELLSFNSDEKVSPFICSKLGLAKGSSVSKHERLRYLEGVPIGLQSVYCPSFLNLTEEELSKPNSSLYQLFKEKGYEINSANETIGSVVADERIAKYLNVKVGSPLLFVQRVTTDKNNRIVEYAEIYYRGDRYQYSVQLKVN